MKKTFRNIQKSLLFVLVVAFSTTKSFADLPTSISISSCYQQVSSEPNNITPFRFIDGVPVTITTVPANVTPTFYLYEIVDGLVTGNYIIADYGLGLILPDDKTYSVVIPPLYVGGGGPGGEVDPIFISTAPFNPTFTILDEKSCYTYNESRYVSFDPNLDGLCITPSWRITNPLTGNTTPTSYAGNGNEYNFNIPDDGFCDIPLDQGVVGIRCQTLTIAIDIEPCDLNNINCPILTYTFPISVCCECEPWHPSEKTQTETGELQQGKMGVVAATTTNDVSVYPNPFTNQINVVTSQEVKQVIIKDLAGKEIATVNGTKVETSNLKKGVYVLEIHTEAGNIIQKRIIK